ncbi:MAG: hypothetical protein WA364_13770 [Candidatus Nitrosopolaris sp.]
MYHARTAVVGKIPQRVQKARSMGADATTIIDNHNDDGGSDDNARSISKILDFTDGIGANVIIIATSDPAAFDFSLKIASKNSRINIFSGMTKCSFQFHVLYETLCHKQLVKMAITLTINPAIRREFIH